jgi:hypothetical protein
MRLALNLAVWLLLSGGSSEPEMAIVTIERSSQCGSWEVAVYTSGFAHAHSTGSCSNKSRDKSTLRRVSAGQLRKLSQAIKDATFETLPASLEPDTIVTDEDVLTITVRTAGNEKAVRAFGLDRLKDRALVRRFLAVWDAVNAIAPEPSESHGA